MKRLDPRSRPSWPGWLGAPWRPRISPSVRSKARAARSGPGSFPFPKKTPFRRSSRSPSSMARKKERSWPSPPEPTAANTRPSSPSTV